MITVLCYILLEKLIGKDYTYWLYVLPVLLDVVIIHYIYVRGEDE